MACSVKISDGVIMQGVSARIFGTRMYSKLWEHVMKRTFLNNEIWVQWRHNSELIKAAKRCYYWREMPILGDDVVIMCPSDLIA